MSAAGQILNGRYRVERLLGSGGFADVYLATDLGPLGRQVAVKVLHAHLVRQPDFLNRFRSEAAMLAQLKHPHILDVYDFGEAEGTLYLVLPYIAGGTLDDQLRRGTPEGGSGRIEPSRVSRYLGQIAGALDFAHARRIVHRDLKPGNFLIDSGDNLLLADFGIAKLLQEASQSQGGTGAIGTVPYMAPEIFRGQAGPGSDIYALGCIVFQLLTGAPPYSGTTEQLMYAHSFEPVPTPAERGLSGLPPALGQVLARALAKRPEERYQSAGEFAQAFDVALGGQVSQQINYGPATMMVQAPQPTSQPFNTLIPSMEPTRPMGQPPQAAYGAPTAKASPNAFPVPAWNQPTQGAARGAAGQTSGLAGAQAGANVSPPVRGWAAPMPNGAMPQPAMSAAAPSGLPLAQPVKAYKPPKRRRWPRWLLYAAGVVVLLVIIANISSAFQASNERDRLSKASPEDQAKAQVASWAAGGTELLKAESGSLKHNTSNSSIEAYYPKYANAADFVVEATFFNPYAATSGSWDYGFIFREASGGSQYRLVLQSNGLWNLDLLLDRTSANSSKSLQAGGIPNFNTSSGGKNRLMLAVKGDAGLLFVNDVYVAKLDVSTITASGKLGIATGMYSGDERASFETGYAGFKITEARK